jgi:CO/xanthine dehydrogenase FAD-binding subunit
VSVIAPGSLEEALAELAVEPDRQPLAGGSDFMVEVNFDRRRPSSVLSLHRVAELQQWSNDAEKLVLGAGVTCAMLEQAPFTRLAPALAQAARTVGSPQIRNVATIGGNLCTASPAGDLLPVLSALDASITCVRTGGTRTLSIHEFLVGPKRTALQAGELVARIEIPVAQGGQEFLKVGTRNAMVIAVASVAMVAIGAEARIALGSVGPTVIRARQSERWFADFGDDPRVLDELADRVAEEARPIDDHRSTAAYRRHAIRVCTARAAHRIFGGGA